MKTKNRIQNLLKAHSRGLCICENALVELEKIFQGIDGFLHCQTGQDGSIEVIIDMGETVPNDYSVWEALEMLEADNEN
jgi:hypothetical protein